MRHKIYLIGVIFSFFISACQSTQPTTIGSYIDILGVVVNKDGEPIEDATVVIFLDDVEIARIQTVPLPYCNSYSGYAVKPRSSYVGYDCNNFIQRIERYADFDIENTGEHKDSLANARLITPGQAPVTFRSYDGRFLVIMAFDSQPPRNVLLLQPDNSIATPEIGQIIPTPRLSSTLTNAIEPTFTPNPVANVSNQAVEKTLWDEWGRPFVIALMFSLIISSGVYIWVERKNKELAEQVIASKMRSATKAEKKPPAEKLNSLGIAITTEIVSGILLTLVLKVFGWS